MPYTENGKYWPDMRDGLGNNPCASTPLLGQWQFAYKDEYLIKVIESLEDKASLVEAGLDEYSEGERFAYNVLMCQWEFRNGKLSEVIERMEKQYCETRRSD